MAKIQHPKGALVSKMGWREGNTLWLWPFETVFLIERGDLFMPNPYPTQPGESWQTLRPLLLPTAEEENQYMVW
jgi:hypothetical protein